MKSEFLKIIKDLKQKEAFIIPHKNADLDAITSSIILSKITENKIFLKGGYLKNTEYLIYENRDRFIYTSEFIPDNILLIDGSDKAQFIELSEITSKYIIDHHVNSKALWNNVKNKIIERSPSTSFLIFKLILETDLEIDSDLIFLVACGFFSDNLNMDFDYNDLQLLTKYLKKFDLPLKNIFELVWSINIKDTSEKYLKAIRDSKDFFIDNKRCIFFIFENRSHFFLLYDSLFKRFDIDLYLYSVFEDNKTVLRFHSKDSFLKNKLLDRIERSLTEQKIKYKSFSKYDRMILFQEINPEMLIL